MTDPNVVQSVEGRPVRGRITSRVLASGEAVLLLELTLSAGARTEPHRHDHESVCYVLRGRIRTTAGANSRDLGPGEACRHPAGVEHSVEALEESVMLEIKSPPPDPARLFGSR